MGFKHDNSVRTWFSREDKMGFNSLHATGTFMCLYKIEKTMYFILTSNVKSPYKFTYKPYGCIKTWLGKS